MKRTALIFALLGLIAATFVVIYAGADLVLDALVRAGFVGIVVTSLFHFVPMTLSTIGWQYLFPGKTPPSLGVLTYVMWLRASVNNLMPVARVGGEVVAVRLLSKMGYSRTLAISTTVVELTSSVIGVFLFTVIGIGLFAAHVGQHHVVWKLFAAVLLTLIPLAILLIVQKYGFFLLIDKMFQLILRGHWQKIMGNAVRLDRAVHLIYRRRTKFLIGLVWQTIAWFVGSVEIWLALIFLGHSVTVTEAIMIEALIQAASSAAFAVPGALGVQEAGFLFFGQMLGLSRETAVALAVVRRCRDLVLFVPGLIAWQIQEGRWLFDRSKKA